MTRDHGVAVAALTPRGKRGELNFGACFELIDHLCKAKVNSIALLTAAGEYSAFTIDERTRLVYLGAKRTRAPLLAGVGAEELDTAVALARDALAAGVEAVVLPPPLLLTYPREELREYYLQFAAQVGRRSAVWIDAPADFAAELVAANDFGGVVGVDLRLSSDACAIPELFVALDCARRTGAVARAAALEALVGEFQSWSGRFAPLVAAKVATGLRGISMGALPVPVAPERLRALDEFREWFAGWLPAMKKMAANA
jgi:dihydrodipicolinate synthase/N-acetylneuraminate lyase